MDLSAGELSRPGGVIVGHQSLDPTWATHWALAFAGVSEALRMHHQVRVSPHGARASQGMRNFASTDPRKSSCATLVYIVEGDGLLTVNDKPYRLHPGSWAYIPPRMRIVFTAGEPHDQLFQPVWVDAVPA